MQTWLSAAVAAAAEAGEAILRLYGRAVAVETKADQSPLTAADRASHECLVARLGAGAAALPVLSEEGQARPYAERRDWERFWLIDPLDGTKEFLKRNGEFTVNVALVEAGRPVLGVVLAPVTGVVYVGARGLGAYKAEPGRHYREASDLVSGAADPAAAGWLRLPSVAMTPGCVRVVSSRSHENDATRAYLAALEASAGRVERLAIGSSLKLCLVAEGAADLYPRLAPTMEWDTAAAQAVVEAAGGAVLEHPGGQPLRCNKADLHNPFFVACRAGLSTAGVRF